MSKALMNNVCVRLNSRGGIVSVNRVPFDSNGYSKRGPTLGWTMSDTFLTPEDASDTLAQAMKDSPPFALPSIPQLLISGLSVSCADAAVAPPTNTTETNSSAIGTWILMAHSDQSP